MLIDETLENRHTAQHGYFYLYFTEDVAVKNRLSECLETILNKAQEPPKSKKVQHSNAKNAVLFEAINLIIHTDSDPNLLVRACNQLGQFLQHRETNLRFVHVFRSFHTSCWLWLVTV